MIMQVVLYLYRCFPKIYAHNEISVEMGSLAARPSSCLLVSLMDQVLNSIAGLLFDLQDSSYEGRGSLPMA